MKCENCTEIFTDENDELGYNYDNITEYGICCKCSDKLKSINASMSPFNRKQIKE